MELARQEASLSDRFAVLTLAKVEAWSRGTTTGDLAELPGLDDRSPVIPWVTSSRENCLGSQCPRFRGCHVNNARREALAADVVVINHHLFFADLSVRESGMAELLPSVRVAIFDEAHQLNEIGVQFLGTQLATSQLIDFCRDMLGAGLQLARGLVDWQQVAARVERAARDLRLAVGGGASGSRLAWSAPAPDTADPQIWEDALEATAAACEQAMDALETVSEIAPDFVRLFERAQSLAQRARRFIQPCEPGSVRWADVGQQLRLTQSPLDIAQAVRSRLLKVEPVSAGPDGEDLAGSHEQQDPDEVAPSSRSWIFTSATLGDDARLTWFTEPCGLTDARVLRVDSPFDYARQAALYVPPGLAKPSDPSHSGQVAELAAQGAVVLGGRTMVLTTTLRALRAIGESLQARFQGSAEIEVLVQGQWPKRRLIERFRQGASGPGGAGCLLVASASFWEGVDVPGDALQLVVIDKLPFPPPGDPLVQARSQRLQVQGRNPFNEYHIPEAAVSLKQGAGRLIRRESDQGLLVLCDSRLTSMGYGRRLLTALPPMRRLTTPHDYAQALRDLALTKASTTDPAWT
jgi:ATP-dependent DNA helicase DinG